MKRFKTINNINMIQCGDYNWEILNENDGSEVFKMTIAAKKESQSNLILLYGEGIFSIREFSALYEGGFYPCFKVEFKETPFLVKALLDGENGFLRPIFHKDTVKIKQ